MLTVSMKWSGSELFSFVCGSVVKACAYWQYLLVLLSALFSGRIFELYDASKKWVEIE